MAEIDGARGASPSVRRSCGRPNLVRDEFLRSLVCKVLREENAAFALERGDLPDSSWSCPAHDQFKANCNLAHNPRQQNRPSMTSRLQVKRAFTDACLKLFGKLADEVARGDSEISL